jgi:hypothetical protein
LIAIKNLEPVLFQQKILPVVNYFFVVSALALVVSTAALLVSTAALVVSTVTVLVVSTVVLVESVAAVEVEEPPPQAVRVAATTITKSTFFMFFVLSV